MNEQKYTGQNASAQAMSDFLRDISRINEPKIEAPVILDESVQLDEEAQLDEEVKPINQKSDDDNGYVGIYKGKQAAVYAKTTYDAQKLIAAHFKAKKSYDVTVKLAEKDGKQVTHVAEEVKLTESPIGQPIEDKGMVLVDEKTGKVIAVGQKLKTFRGEKFTIKSGTAPKHSGSTGKVYDGSMEYYPGVVGAKWVKSSEADLEESVIDNSKASKSDLDSLAAERRRKRERNGNKDSFYDKDGKHKSSAEMQKVYEDATRLALGEDFELIETISGEQLDELFGFGKKEKEYVAPDEDQPSVEQDPITPNIQNISIGKYTFTIWKRKSGAEWYITGYDRRTFEKVDEIETATSRSEAIKNARAAIANITNPSSKTINTLLHPVAESAPLVTMEVNTDWKPEYKTVPMGTNAIVTWKHKSKNEFYGFAYNRKTGEAHKSLLTSQSLSGLVRDLRGMVKGGNEAIAEEVENEIPVEVVVSKLLEKYQASGKSIEALDQLV